MSMETTIEMPCLGRPFQPGMLYDCRSDRLIPGLTLWDAAVLENHLSRKPTPHFHSEVTVEDTLSEKASKFGVDPSLKLSLLSGLFEVSGSANYLTDRKKSAKQTRLTLRYSAEMHYDHLTMTHLGPGNIQYTETFNDQDATHVVTAVSYGADAVFVCDHEFDSNDQSDKVYGDIKAAVKIVSGEMKGKFNKDEQKMFDKINCKFYGDFELDRNPTNLNDAINLYRDLPSMMKKQGPVPKKVWLYPLAKLDGKVSKLVREISFHLVMEVETIVERLHTLEIEINDIIKSCHPLFSDMKQQIGSFKGALTEFRNGFQNKLLAILPKIRGGADEEELLKLMKSISRSPFNADQLQLWIDGKCREVNMLTMYANQMIDALGTKKAHIAVTKSEVDQLLYDLKLEYAVGFAFVVKQEDSFLSNLHDYLRKQTDLMYENAKPRFLYQDFSIKNKLVTSVNAFIKFVESNWESRKTRFFIYADDTYIGNQYAYILLYNITVGSKPTEFVPPPVPGRPTAKLLPSDSAKSLVSLAWTVPELGLKTVTNFKIWYSIVTKSYVHDWKEYANSSLKLNAVINGLSVDKSYVFRVSSVCPVGVSEHSDISDPIQILYTGNGITLFARQ